MIGAKLTLCLLITTSVQSLTNNPPSLFHDRLKESLARARSSRYSYSPDDDDEDRGGSELVNAQLEKRIGVMDGQASQVFQASLVKYVRRAYGEEVWGKVKAKCAEDSLDGRSSNCLQSRCV